LPKIFGEAVLFLADLMADLLFSVGDPDVSFCAQVAR
jgi:hypothetical protein